MGDRKWQPGDIVRLKTGGWPMTVEFCTDEMFVDGVKYTPDQKDECLFVMCVWFQRTWDGAREEYIWDGPKRDTFHVSALDKSEPLK